jgi:hypothetical protein
MNIKPRLTADDLVHRAARRQFRINLLLMAILIFIIWIPLVIKLVKQFKH